MNKETLSHIKPKRTPEQIAVEGRSPNRGERVRLERIRRRTKGRKETFVEEKRLGKTDEEAAAIILTPLERVLQWQRYDIDFGKECREAIDTLRLRAQGGIATLLPQAVEVAEKLLKSGSEKVQLGTVALVLKGMGVLVEKQENHQEGPIEHILRVVYDDSDKKRNSSSPEKPSLPPG